MSYISCVRVLFVRAGTQSGAPSSLMTSNSFRYSFIGLTQLFTAFNVLTYCNQIFTKSGSEKSSFLLYQACYQPEGVNNSIFLAPTGAREMQIFGSNLSFFIQSQIFKMLSQLSLRTLTILCWTVRT